MAANLLSYHLRVLRDAGLVTAARRGRWIDYRLDPDGFAVLWAQMSAAGVPLPGGHITAARRGPACDDRRPPVTSIKTGSDGTAGPAAGEQRAVMAGLSGWTGSCRCGSGRRWPPGCCWAASSPA